MNRSTLTAAAAVALAMLLAGCTGTTSSAQPTTSNTATPPHISASPYPHGEGVAAATVLTTCQKKPGNVTATGTFSLPQAAKGDRAIITVSWVNAKTANLLASNAVMLTALKPGKKTKWAAHTTLPKSKANVRCVLSAVVPKSSQPHPSTD